MSIINHQIVFIASCLAFAFVPGPAMIYTVSKTLSEGTKSGLMVVAGIFIGSQVHVLIASAGAASLFMSSPGLFNAMKALGGSYLIFIGLSIIYKELVFSYKNSIKKPIKAKSTLRESFFIETFNPKSSLFFLAFIPQFLPQDTNDPITMLLIIGTAANLIMSIGDMSIVIITSHAKKFSSSFLSTKKWGKFIAPLVYISLGGYVIIY